MAMSAPSSASALRLCRTDAARSAGDQRNLACQFLRYGISLLNYLCSDLDLVKTARRLAAHLAHGCYPEGGINSRHSYDEVGNNHRSGTDGGPIDHPQQCGGRLDPAERSRLSKKVGTREDGCRCPAKRIKPHIKPPYAPAGARAMVSESVRTNPCDSNRARIRVESQPAIASRIGTSTLRASSLRTVRLAICVTYGFSDTAIVSPSN